MDGAPTSAEVKPRLRGWLHVAAAPAALIIGLVLTWQAPAHLRVAVLIFTLSATALFTSSALLHRGRWGERTNAALRRLDHSTIFLLIAGSMTPFAAALLPPGHARVMLWVVWLGAVAGVLFRVLWLRAPRWLYVPVYLALGWTAVVFSPWMVHTGGWAVVLLLLLGGVFYSAGAVIYALGRPNPWPRTFGFHEIFHSFTLGGITSHYAAAGLVVFGVAAAQG